MKRYIKHFIPVAALAVVAGMSTSCTGDLDVNPIDPNLVLLGDSTSYLFNKCYANIALAGNSGPDGDCDIDGLDGGTTGLIRQLFNTNELPTDEAICTWSDPGIPDFNYNTYDGSHPMVKGYYYRLYNGITLCNHYLDVASDKDATMTAEVRFLRALYYYLALDGYGKNIPFTTTVSSAKAKAGEGNEIYEFIESELLDCEANLSEAKAKNSTDANYGRVDKAAAWQLLSRLYLNAEVYTGTAQWAKAAEYAKKVIDSPYKLNTTPTTRTENGVTYTWSAYQKLFMGDNGESSAATEAVFPILQDGLTTASYGTSLFLIAGCFNANHKEDNHKDGNTCKGMHANPFNPMAMNGTSETWGGNCARPDLINKFFPNGDAPNVESYNMTVAAGDDRAIFWGKDCKVDCEDITGNFTNGFAVAKFVNTKSDGSAPHDSKFADTDFFLFRSAEAYLTYAEATARQNGGNTTSEGAGYVNQLRARANASQKASYSLKDILDEWSREFYFEGRRRTDLVRYGYYGGNNGSNWRWKGGTYEGRNFEAYRNIYDIPTSDITANDNLKHNNGYN